MFRLSFGAPFDRAQTAGNCVRVIKAEPVTLVCPSVAGAELKARPKLGLARAVVDASAAAIRKRALGTLQPTLGIKPDSEPSIIDDDAVCNAANVSALCVEKGVNFHYVCSC
jgi:hypothetical protein